jgi:hypothetical protein
MNRADFTHEATAEGYMILYKGRKLGGASILGKYKGRRRWAQVQEHAATAKREIDALTAGGGQARFRAVIAKIDAGEVEA